MSELNISQILPEIMLCLAGVLILVVTPFLRKSAAAGGMLLTLAGLAAAGIGAWAAGASPGGTSFHGMVSADPFGTYVRLLILGIGTLMAVSSAAYLKQEKLPSPEFNALLLFALAGMDFMVISANLVFTFIGLEILSIATYVLAGFRRDDPKSNEAGLKYFFMGALSSAVMLYGIALVYGSTGSTAYGDILRFTAGCPSIRSLPLMLGIGVALVVVGFAFKVAVAPFHVWTPDVYEGAPVPVTAFMSAGPKAAGFAALLRVLFQFLPAGLAPWTQFLMVTAILTMLIGNLAAVSQTNVKRMLAYSSIAHAGYILIGATAGTTAGLAALLFYLAAYALMNIGAFTIVGIIAGPGEERVDLDDYQGLGFRYPVLTLPLTVCLVSLAGIPSTAGFIGKFFLFSAAVERGMYPLVIVAVLASLVSVYYYLRVVVAMFMTEKETRLAGGIPVSAAGVALLCGGLILLFGLFPSWLLDLATRAVAGFIAN